MAIGDSLHDWLTEQHGIESRPLPYYVEKGGVFLKDAAGPAPGRLLLPAGTTVPGAARNCTRTSANAKRRAEHSRMITGDGFPRPGRDWLRGSLTKNDLTNPQMFDHYVWILIWR
jgi:hypothetical protein